MGKAVEKLLTNIADLFKVKTILTLEVITTLTIAFMKGDVPIELYISICTAIVTYYFTKRDDTK